MFKKQLKAFSQNKKDISQSKKKKFPLSALAIIITGSISLSLAMARSGLVYDFGLGFWGPNGHDGIWHIALANSLLHFPWQMPNFASSSITNYHIGFDLLLAVIHFVTTIPLATLYFQIIPPILAVLTGILTFKFVHSWKKSKSAATWATFFVYFGGSFGWIITLLKNKTLGGESIFWSQQAVSTLINPPFALSLVVLLLALISLQNKKTLLSIIFFGFLIQIKSYAGILAIGSLLVSSVYQILTQKKLYQLKIFVLSLLLSLIIFLPLNSSSSSLLVFKPFWFLETMMQVSDRLGWQKFGEAMVNYKYAGNFPKAISAYAVAFTIFIIGNFGTRIISIKYLIQKLDTKKLDSFDVQLFSLISAGIILPMLFLQKGTPWNTIQFFYYSLFFLSILSGITLSKIKNKAVSFVVIALTIPTTLSTLSQNYLTKNPPSYLSKEEYEALTFLSKQSHGIVLTFPFDEKASLSQPAPKPLYRYVSTSYVSAFSKKPTLLSDEMNADITSLNWKEKKEEILTWYNTLNQQEAHSFLREQNITYIYWIKPQRARLGETQLGVERLYENKLVDIYKVK